MKAVLKEWVRGSKLLYPLAMVLMKKKPAMSGIRKHMRGNRNTVSYPTTAILSNCTIDVQGNNNRVRIGDYCTLRNVSVIIRGNNNEIDLAMAVKFNLGGSLHIEDDNCAIRIGSRSTFEDVHIAATEDGSHITIGEDCMFAYDIDVRSGDSHSIIDLTTNERINHAGDVIIGNHVWVAAHCSVLKGVHIGNNCILATRSVLTRSYDGYGLILGGCPARVLKTNITWSRQRTLVSRSALEEKGFQNESSNQIENVAP